MLAKKRPVNNVVLPTLFSVIGYVIYHGIFHVGQIHLGDIIKRNSL